MYRIFWTIILLTETELSNIWHYVPFQNALINWFYCACTDSRYPMQAAAKQPINIMKPLPCFQAVIVFCSLKTSFVFFCEYDNCSHLAKRLSVLFHCLPEWLWFVNLHFGKLQSGFCCLCLTFRSEVFLDLLLWWPLSMADSTNCCTLKLEVRQDLIWNFPWFFFHHLNSSVQCGVSFPLVAYL